MTAGRVPTRVSTAADALVAAFSLAGFEIEPGHLCFWGLWVLAASVWTFFLMARDKRLARMGRGGAERARESLLLTWGVIGGAPGGLAAMYFVRHKTLHLRFRIIMPLFALAWIVAVLQLCHLTPWA